MKLTIVGTGYVGLVTGTCLAQMGNDVLCVDTDESKVKKLESGIVPIYEPGLEELVTINHSAGRLRFTTSIEEGVNHGQVIFIAVGTPPDEDGSADLRYVLQVAKSIGQHISNYKVVATKSTVPVGTSAKVKQAIQEVLQNRNEAIEFSVVSNPEFLKEGAAVDDFMKPDRVVIGYEDERALKIMRELYAPFNRNRERIIAMDIASSELTKYTANAMLATKISFMNEISNLAEMLGADIEAVRVGIGSDPRIGFSFIYPGCGYGGSCFPKDVQALHRTAKQIGYDARILHAVEAVNDAQKQIPFKKLKSALGENLKGKKIAVWGLAFKPETDDMREAPSRVLIDSLLAEGAQVHAFDPVATEEAKRIYGDCLGLTFESENPYDVLHDAQALILLTEWQVFRSPDFERIAQLMQGDAIIDGRNIFKPESVKNAGLRYYGIGRS